MAFYETVFIARQDISTQSVEKIADDYANIIKNEGGKILKTEFWGLRNLAYMIKKNRKGHYVMFCIEAANNVIKELKHKMKYDENILRSAIFSLEEFSDKPSSMVSGNKSDDKE